MPDVTTAKFDEIEGFYHGLFLKARAALGVESFGLAVVVIEPRTDPHPDHDHPDQEEVYLLLDGEATLHVEGEQVELDRETLVRVGPNTKRKLTAGPDGAKLLAIGGVPGKAYEAPGYSELGAPDPLG